MGFYRYVPYHVESFTLAREFPNSLLGRRGGGGEQYGDCCSVVPDRENLRQNNRQQVCPLSLWRPLSKKLFGKARRRWRYPWRFRERLKSTTETGHFRSRLRRVGRLGKGAPRRAHHWPRRELHAHDTTPPPITGPCPATHPGQPNESIFILTNLANGGVSGVQQSPF